MGPDKAWGRRVLILGGTTEASALVRELDGRAPEIDVTLSLAGRTTSPKPEPVPTRIGGFGGADGLAVFLARHDVERVVDATHPFAARMSANAARACSATKTPLLALRRPPWKAVDGDRWIEVDDMATVVSALGAQSKRVFLTIGRQELLAFAAAPQHDYLVRTIEPVGDALPVPRLRTAAARGPFSASAEEALMREAGIEVLVTKNAGGSATYAKIAAARRLGLPVIVVRRPEPPDVPAVADVEAALRWVTESRGHHPATPRGV